MEIVSIIVPVYKVEKYLEKCVKSILEQTYSALEVILVDDGSPDRCGKMCDEYANHDKRIKVIHKENGGLSDARNTGILNATGKYLMFVDSDDWIRKDAVEQVVEKAEQYRTDIVLFDYVRVEEDTNIERCFSTNLPEEVIISGEDTPQLICKSCSACNKLFRKDFWEQTKVSFPVGRYYEDLGTIPKLMGSAKRVIYVKEAFYFYLQRKGSIMHTSDLEKNYKDRIAMTDGVIEFYTSRNLFGKYQKELEYLIFENTYFIPSKEIVLNDRKSIYLKKFRKYALNRFPNMHQNPYIKEMSKRDKTLYKLLRYRGYGIMILLSKARQLLEKTNR